MRTRGRHIQALLMIAIVVALPALAAAEPIRAGVVTTLLGDVKVVRAALPVPAPLHFKDEVFVQDRIETGERSVARILLGGKALVTVREHSSLTITEMPGVSTVNLSEGRIAVAVAKQRMQKGEVVEIRTPNAVAGIRGTIVIAEVGRARHSTITVLRGLIDVTRLDPVSGRPVGHAVDVGALQSVTVTRAAPVPPPTTITPGAAQRLSVDFEVPRRETAPAPTLVKAEVERAVHDLARLVPAPGAPEPDDATPGEANLKGDGDKGDRPAAAKSGGSQPVSASGPGAGSGSGTSGGSGSTGGSAAVGGTSGGGSVSVSGTSGGGSVTVSGPSDGGSTAAPSASVAVGGSAAVATPAVSTSDGRGASPASISTANGIATDKAARALVKELLKNARKDRLKGDEVRAKKND